MKRGTITKQWIIRRPKLFLTPFFLLLVFLFSMLSVSSQESVPSWPNAFWGIASLNGNPVSSGITIEAYIVDGTLVSTTTTTGGKYTITVSGTNGDTVNFRICSLVASQIHTLNKGEVNNLNLSADGTCPSDDSGSTGGGSNGGGTSTPVLQISSLNTTNKESHFYNTLNPSKTTTFVIKNTKFSFKKISFSVNKLSNNVNITFSILDKLPSYISSLEKVYQYIVVETENLDDNVENVEIEFKVPKSWFNTKKYDKGKIALIRYYDGWSTLNTTLVNEDDSYVYYTAKSPGFSIFAVKVLETVENPAPDMPNLISPQPREEDKENISESEGDEPKQYTELNIKGVILNIFITLAVVVVLFIIFKISKKFKKK